MDYDNFRYPYPGGIQRELGHSIDGDVRKWSLLRAGEERQIKKNGGEFHNFSSLLL